MCIDGVPTNTSRNNIKWQYQGPLECQLLLLTLFQAKDTMNSKVVENNSIVKSVLFCTLQIVIYPLRENIVIVTLR